MSEITDYDNTFCDIKWTPSERDGGSPITHYIVQTKTNNGDWVTESELQTPKGDEKLEKKITGLTENDKIQFRTIAVNKAGESEPSDPSPVPPHVVKHRNSKFQLGWFHLGGTVEFLIFFGNLWGNFTFWTWASM